MAQLTFDIMAVEADVIKDQNINATGSLYGGAKGIWTGTQEQYDAYDEYDDQIIYFIIAEED
jgi:hypothetical protein